MAAVGVVVKAVVVVVTEVVVEVAVSFALAFQAQRMDRDKLTLEEPKEKWHCCLPSRSGDMRNSWAAAWHPAPGKGVLLSVL